MFTPGLLDDADSTHAEAAREMVATGDYVTLHINGVRYLEKPPLPYWLVAFSYKVFGVNEFSTRLPMVLSVMLLGVLAFCWGRRAFGDRTGIYAALFVYTCAGIYLFTRVLIPDVLLSLLIAAALYLFLTALEPGASPWRWYAGYSLMALGVLTKGLIALVFPGGAAFFFLLVTGEWRRWREFRLLSGLVLFFAIAAPWHIVAGLRNPGTAQHHGFFWFYFVNEHFLRFLGKRYPRDYSKLPATLYWSLHLVWLFPWSLYLPAALRTAMQAWRGRSHGISDPGVTSRRGDFAERTRLLCWIFAGVVLIFFAISTNQEYYTFPAYLPLLLLLADGIAQGERVECQGRKRAGWLVPSAGVLAGSWYRGQHHALDRTVAVTELTVRSGHWKCPEHPGHRRLHTFDVASAGLELRFVRGTAAAGHARRNGVAAGSIGLANPASISSTLFRDLDAGDRNGGVSGGRAYCSGTIWPVPFFEAIGA